MALNKKQQNTILRRREAVGRYALEGMTTREISEALAQQDPPIKASHVTIAKDLQTLRTQWLENTGQDIATLKARQLAEIAEAKKQAWQLGDLQALARFLKLEADITGTNAPIKIEELAEKKAVKILLDDLMVANPDLYQQLLAHLTRDGQTHKA